MIKSISGIRGTIGGSVSESLNPINISRFTAAFATLISRNEPARARKVVVGRDARPSGVLINRVVTGTLLGMGFDVIDLGLATTPTCELAVLMENAAGGIIITASHNPKDWNALKLLNGRGEFLDACAGEEVLRLAAEERFAFAPVERLGHLKEDGGYTQRHIENVLSLSLVDAEAIRKADFSIAVDAVNSVGGVAVPALLEALGIRKIKKINCTPDGQFAHNPEPLPEHLGEIAATMARGGYDVGFAIDPDVDRLAIICEDGSAFGEEYSLVAVADYVLRNTPGNTVSNLSSTRALRDITESYGGKYTASAVGETNVVAAMKATNAVIGGEGNGGIIYPASHYGRDALVGIALFLTLLAKSNMPVSALKKRYPAYFISKNKIRLTPELDADEVLRAVRHSYRQYETSDIDGVKIDFPDGWVHLRKSNTEPIVRIYAEAATVERADELAQTIMNEVRQVAQR